MKKEIFYEYVNQVSIMFEIDREILFTKTKKRDVVDARYLIYYLAIERKINVIYIQQYMLDGGYDTNHSSVCRGINVVRKKVESDVDYIDIINKLNSEVNKTQL
jgi:hypothetical protein